MVVTLRSSRNVNAKLGILSTMYEEIYTDEIAQLWSGNLNHALVREITSEISRGKALDIGAGEGADAIWLSQQGFAVTALEPSHIAATRILQLAEKQNIGLNIIEDTFEQADLGSYELVTAFYTPVRANTESVDKLLATVAPSGWLLVVHHTHSEITAQHEHKHPDDLLPKVLQEILENGSYPDFQVVKYGTFERHVTEGGGAGHTHDDVIMVRRSS